MGHPEWLSQALRELMIELRVQSAQADAAEAAGWLVVSRDEENGSLHISGPYDTPEAALIAAQRDHEEVNRDLAPGEAGWTHIVRPLFPPT